MNKEEQKHLLIEMMREDEKSGMYLMTLQECKDHIARNLPFAYDSWFEMVLHLQQADFKGLLKLYDDAAELYAQQFKEGVKPEPDFDGPLAMVDHYQKLARYFENEAAKWERKYKEEGVGQKEAGWISLKDRLPEDDNMFCVFAKWYEPWKSWHSCEGMTWKEFKGCRKYDLENEYTHWQPLPSHP